MHPQAGSRPSGPRGQACIATGGILWRFREILAGVDPAMRFSVVVTPGARRELVDRIDATRFRVAVTAPAGEGRANAAVVRALAEFFSVIPSRVRVIRGATSRHKIVEIGGVL